MSLLYWKDPLTSISANVISAVLLFILALIFKPFIYDLFRTPVQVDSYPLQCVFEVYGDDEKGVRRVDIFIVNTQTEEYTFESLQSELNRISPDEYVRYSPAIPIVMRDDEPGEIESVKLDERFNKDKGTIRSTIEDGRRTAYLAVERIVTRAVMKATISIENTRDLGVSIERTAKIMIPFEYRNLKENCYRRM
jgi:hypothetical protein